MKIYYSHGTVPELISISVRFQYDLEFLQGFKHVDFYSDNRSSEKEEVRLVCCTKIVHISDDLY